MSKHYADILISLLAALALSACDSAQEGPGDIERTNFPGQVSAGGGTGGEVMAKNGTLQAKANAQSSPVLVTPQTPSPSSDNRAGGVAGPGTGQPAGTPGIPEGSEGTVSGTAMGGTTPGAASAKQPAAPRPEANDTSSKESQSQAKAEREKQQLEASMNAVAQRWQAIASARGWQLENSSEGGTSGFSAAGETQTSAIGLPSFIRSEKLGTAPPSEDLKNPAQDPSN